VLSNAPDQAPHTQKLSPENWGGAAERPAVLRYSNRAAMTKKPPIAKTNSPIPDF